MTHRVETDLHPYINAVDGALISYFLNSMRRKIVLRYLPVYHLMIGILYRNAGNILVDAYGAWLMGISRPESSRLNAMALPIGMGVIAAVTTMFIPTTILEAITGSTGLSEIFPATGAPLGDTARALIAFGTGSLTLAASALVQNRKGKSDMASSAIRREANRINPENEQQPESTEDNSLMSKLRSKLEYIGRNGVPMPWSKKPGDDNIFDLRDLPKLRKSDAHPDAPARRPLSVDSDVLANSEQSLPDTLPNTAPHLPDNFDIPLWNDASGPLAGQSNLSPIGIAPVASQSVEEVAMQPQVQAEFASNILSAEKSEPPVHTGAQVQTFTQLDDASQVATAPVTVPSKPSSEVAIEDLFVKLEASVQRRLALIAQVRAEAKTVEPVPQPVAFHTPIASVTTQPVNEILPPLSVQPLTPVIIHNKPTEEPMDEALRAAIATLQKMNAQAR
jgi:hypothetical protein